MTTKLVLFDMGGVLVELGPLAELLGVDEDSADFWPRWLTSETVRAFEQGRCSVDEFGEGLVTEFALPISAEQLVENFARFPRGLFEGAAELVEETASVVDTGILSNTNALHWDRQPDAEVIRSLGGRSFLSYQLGMLKPDAEIFNHIVATTGYKAEEILFLDDNQLNVDGARNVGLRSERTVGVAEARQALQRHSVLPA